MARQGWGSSRRLSFAERLECSVRCALGNGSRTRPRRWGSSKSVQRLLAKSGGVAPRVTERSAGRLSAGGAGRDLSGAARW